MIVSNEKGPVKSPLYYYITVTDPNDLFIYFKSIEITHSKFLEITSQLNIDVPGIVSDKKPDNMISDHPKRAREAALGFHTSEGAGGVIGVIAGDCLNGIQYEPERYYGCFEILPQNVHLPSSSAASSNEYIAEISKPNERSCKEWKMEGDVVETNNNNTGWNEVMSSKLNAPAPVKKKEVLRKAVLRFKERVMYRTKNLLNISFEEAPQEELMAKVNDQYVNLQVKNFIKL
jgi:hypothetical protein